MTRILLADDDDLLVALVEVRLESQGFEVVIAHDGPSALEQARAERPDVIVLDAMMPGCDGFFVAEQLRHDERTRHIPVLMLTARRCKDDVVKAMRAGVRDYVAKPFRIEELVTRLKRIVAEQERAAVQGAA